MTMTLSKQTEKMEKEAEDTERGGGNDAPTLHKLLRTGLIFVSCAIMGMYTNILGPSLLDIGYFTGSTTTSVTTIFLWRYSGYLVCSLLIGPFIDRINEYFLIAVSFIGMAVAAGLTPWWPHLTIFYVTFTIGGISSCMGSINTVTAVIMIWAASSDPYQQAAFLGRSVGTSLTPQIFKPFLIATHTNDTNHTEQLLQRNISDDLFQTNDTQKEFSKASHNIGLPPFYSRNFQFQYGYLIISICLFCGAVMNFIIFIYDGQKILRPKKKITKIIGERTTIQGYPKIIALVLKFMMGFLLASIEESFGGLVMTFCVRYLEWTEKSSTDMNTVFFAACAASRLLGIPLAKVMRASRTLAIQGAFIVVGYLVLAIAVNVHWVVPWVSASLIGLGFGSSYPSLLNWSNSYMVLRGKETSVFFVSVALGRMTAPPFVAFLFEGYSPVWFMYVGLIYALALTMVYVVKYIFVSYSLSKAKRLKELEEDEADISLRTTDEPPLKNGSI